MKHAPINDADYTASSADSVIGYRSLTGHRTVTLPDPSTMPSGGMLVIQDESGNCSMDVPITVLAPSGGSLAGDRSVNLVTPYQRLLLTHNDLNLWIYS